MINTIIFDIGNVLAGFSWELCLEELSYDKDMIERIGNATVRDLLWRELDRSDHVEESLIEEFIRKDSEIGDAIGHFIRNSALAVREYDYACKLVESLKNQGYKLYLLSNYCGDNYRYAMENFRFIPLMDGGVISYEVASVKPEPKIYQTLLDTYNIVPEEAVFLDDLEINIEAAKAMGIHGIVFRSLAAAIEELKELGVKI